MQTSRAFREPAPHGDAALSAFAGASRRGEGPFLYHYQIFINRHCFFLSEDIPEPLDFLSGEYLSSVGGELPVDAALALAESGVLGEGEAADAEHLCRLAYASFPAVRYFGTGCYEVHVSPPSFSGREFCLKDGGREIIKLDMP